MNATGLLLSAGFASFLFWSPFKHHVPATIALYAVCFLVYLKFVWGLKKNPSQDVLLAPVFLFAILFRLPLLLFTTPTLSDDIYRYLWDGRVQQAGVNPYVYPPDAPELAPLRNEEHTLINHPTVRTIYPPLAQWVFRLGVAIKPTIFTQKIIFFFFDLATIFLLTSLLRLKNRSTAWVAVYAWNPLVVLEFAGSGHNDSLMIFALVLGLYLFEKSKKNASIIAFAGSALSKLIPLVMVPWLIAQKRILWLIVYATVIVVACLPYIKEVWRMFHAILPPTSGLHAYARDWVFNPSLYGVVGLFIPNPTARKILLGVGLLFFSFFWAVKNKPSPLLYAFGCMYALLLMGPVVHPWYVTWLLPFLCFYPLWSGILWSGLVFLTYGVLVRYASQGIWQLPLWVGILEYTVVYGFLGRELRSCSSR